MTIKVTIFFLNHFFHMQIFIFYIVSNNSDNTNNQNIVSLRRVFWFYGWILKKV